MKERGEKEHCCFKEHFNFFFTQWHAGFYTSLIFQLLPPVLLHGATESFILVVRVHARSDREAKQFAGQLCDGSEY